MRSIFFITANNMTYPAAINDPVFRTTDSPPFTPRNPVSVLVCREKHIFCSPVNRAEVQNSLTKDRKFCVTAGPAQKDEDVFNSRLFSPRQRETGRRIRDLLGQRGVASAVEELGEKLMLGRTASVRAGGGFGEGWVQRKKMDNTRQWVLEVGRWFDISLLVLQMGFLDGLAKWEDGDVWTGLVTEEGGCARQRVSGVAEVTNFDLTAIIATVVVGVVLVLLSMVVVPVVGWWQGRSSRGGQTGVMLWRMDGLFQIQRVAYEANGVTTRWDGRDAVVPTTGERMFPKYATKMASTF
jgi:hypothetical protein